MNPELALDLRISPLEKLIVNWALLPDAVFYSLKSYVTKDRYHHQTFSERCKAMYGSRIKKYEKLLTIKERYGGEIPERIKKICRKSPCNYTRLLLTYLR